MKFRFRFFSFLLATFFLGFVSSCKKETEQEQDVFIQDSTAAPKESTDTLTVVKKIEKEDHHRILTVDASKMPIKLIEEFKSPEDRLIVKLTNVKQDSIKAYLKPFNEDMNIRFNQVRKPDNTFDGPFTDEVIYEANEEGEYWLVVSRNLMQSGNPVGKFFLRVD